MTEIGVRFWRSVPISVLVALSEWAVLLCMVARCAEDRFFSKRGFWLHAGLLALSLSLQFLHLPVLLHCLLTLLCAAGYICLLSGCGWFNGVFEGSIYILFVELGKSVCRDGLLAFGFSRLFPGVGAPALNLTMLGLYLGYLALLCVFFLRRRRRLDLPITTLQAAGLLFPLLLYLAVRVIQYDLVRELDNFGWLRYDLLQYAIAACALLMMNTTASLLSGQLERGELLHRQMLDEQKQRQYEVQRESIDFINRRYHDLKHYLNGIEAALSDNGDSDELTHARELVQTIRQEIDPYASIQRTGSSVMDVLLSQRVQECQSKGIRLLPYIDGSATGFIRILDLCALFGNAMDNAIEAASAFSDEALREISVKIGVSDGLLLMRFFNYHEGNRRRSGAGFESTKDTPEHGFGLRNIAAVAEKYGGTISTDCTDNSFTLHILIPIPEGENP